MLREDVVEAIRNGKFSVLAVDQVSDLIEIMFKMPAGVRGEDGKFPEGTLHAKVETALREVNDKLEGRRRNKDDEPEKPEPHQPEPHQPDPTPHPEPPPQPEPAPEPPPEPGPAPEPTPEPPPSPVPPDATA